MDEPKTEYRVSERTTSVVRSTDPIVIDSVPCWDVTRVIAGSLGWHIGKYKSAKAAQKVADFLAANIGEEIE